ncbi:MAG: hypothetical protein HZB87_05070 [Desulfatitalea sp.]|nr:hypothetical protein [Desulfatitalea sp.]
MPTIRQQIVALLSEKPMDIVALSQCLGLREKETITHLPHIAKSMAGRGGRCRPPAAARAAKPSASRGRGIASPG